MQTKMISILLLLSLALELLSGCGGADTGDLQTFEVPERGLIFRIDQSYLDKGVTVSGYNENTSGFLNANIYYYAPSADAYLDELSELAQSEDTTPEQYSACMEKLWSVSRELMEVVMVDTQRYQELRDAGASLDSFTVHGNAQELRESNGYTYLISIPDLDYGALNEEEIAQYLDCKAYMQEVQKNLQFTEVELEALDTELGTEMPAFTAKDLDGNSVDNSIFAGKDLTVVNVWGTFCAPCISEMPELAAWAEEMPENVQIIGIVGDIEGEEDTEHLILAQEIVRKAGVTFPNLVANDDLSGLLRGIIGYPTTFFVDSEGNIVGDSVVGADVSAYKASVEAYLDESQA